MNASSKVRETKNKLIYNKIVKENWGLTKDGYKLFNHRLLYDRQIAKEYKDIIGDAFDLRKRFPLTEDSKAFYDFLESWDTGFRIFNFVFKHFKDFYNISYENFYNNKFIRDKNEVRIFKGIRDYYKELVKPTYDKEKEGFFFDKFDTNKCQSLFEVSSLIVTFVCYVCFENDDILSKANDFFSLGCETKRFVSQSASEKRSIKVKNGSVFLDIFREGNGTYEIKTLEKLFEIIDFVVTITSEFIGTYKVPKRDKLEFVVSLNPVDWLLCSTEESWSSCLNIKSGYLYWVGLPSLIGDKNRALVYLTDGNKKYFNGMVVDKLLSRSWVLLAREKKTNRLLLDFAREYPNVLGLRQLVKQYIPIPILEEERDDNKKYVGRYYIESINLEAGYDKLEVFSSIYLDSGFIFPAKKNKAKYRLAEYFWYKIGYGSSGSKKFFIDRERGKAVPIEAYVDEDVEDLLSRYRSGSFFHLGIEEGIKFSRMLYLENC